MTRCGVSDHPGAPSLEAAPYRACAVAPPLLCKEGIILPLRGSSSSTSPYRACASLAIASHISCARSTAAGTSAANMNR